MGFDWSEGLSSVTSIQVNAPADVVWSTITDIESMPKYAPNCVAVRILHDNNNNNTTTSSYTPQYDFKEGLKWEEKLSIRHNGRTKTVRRCVTSIHKHPLLVHSTIKNGQGSTSSSSSSSVDVQNVGLKSYLHQKMEMRFYTELPHKWLQRNIGVTRSIVIESIPPIENCIATAVVSGDVKNDDNNNNHFSSPDTTGSCFRGTCRITCSVAMLVHTPRTLLVFLAIGKNVFKKKMEEILVKETNALSKEAERRYQLK